MTSRGRIPQLGWAATVAALCALATQARAVDMHGYFRVNQGTTSNGGDQVYFGNKGQDYKSRLGNESNWAEWELSQLVAKDRNGVEWRAGFMLGYGSSSTGVDESFTAPGDPKDTRAIVPQIKQQYITATFPQLGGGMLWGGTRYHSRMQNELFDYFYYDTSGAGIGLENADLGFAKLSTSIMSVSPAKGQRDFRPELLLSGIKVNPGGELLVGGNVLIATRNEHTDAAIKDPNTAIGPWLIVQHTQNDLFGHPGSGFNVLAVEYAAGPAASMTNAEGNLDKDNYQLQVDEQLMLTPSQRWAVLVTGKLQYKQYGDKTRNTAWAVGARPIVPLNDYLKVYLDVGYFYNKDDQVSALHNGSEKAMTMLKVTPCLAVAPPGEGRIWGIRPDIRVYATYATWNKEQDPAGGAFGTDRSGLTFGTYVESWF